ncbi:helix-turn-helix domain-containing protein [Romboutsia sp. Marseille-P6047]|uniref:helix-turn-helix domain-containing protein n=1 Tax=Romboutsia sp. Marseille-P6047 TaxID=2161817 RepID=UPI000F049138|nr:helix-turn-helix transcriptional regulator [Romboutsia sp. Marseille-P6047]
MNIGENIKKYRKEKCLTQTELAKKVNKSKSTIQKYEANDAMPPIDVLGDIATTLQIPIDFLIGSELIPMQDESGFSGFIDSQFGYFDPNYEGYMEFLERNLSLSNNYKKDNIFVSPSYPSFTSELITCIGKSYSKNNTPLSIDGLKEFLEEQTNIHNIWLINAEKELPLPELIKLLDFYRYYNFNDFYAFINGSSFGFSDLDIDIKNIIQDFKYAANKSIKIPGGFTSKPETINIGLAYKSLVNLIFYIGKENNLSNMNDKSYRKLLMKTCDLLEFELFKLEKEIDQENNE